MTSGNRCRKAAHTALSKSRVTLSGLLAGRGARSPNYGGLLCSHLHVVITPHKGVYGQKLLKGLAAQLEGAIDVPGLSTAQNIQLLVTSKGEVTATSDLKIKTNMSSKRQIGKAKV